MQCQRSNTLLSVLRPFRYHIKRRTGLHPAVLPPQNKFLTRKPSKTQLEKKQDEDEEQKKIRRQMKLVWSPETASKAYIDTVKSCDLYHESGVAELVSAMAAGWNANFIVETWSQGGVMATSIGLAVASRHTGGRHVCIVQNEQSRTEYTEGMIKAGMSPEVMVGEPEEVMDEIVGIDFLVVDCKRKDFSRILRLAKLSSRGAVLVCKNASSKSASSFKWRSVLDGGTRRLVRCVFLPVGMGLDIAYVATSGGNSGSGTKRWIKHVDQQSGEEYAIRK